MNLLLAALYDPAVAVSKATSALLAMTALDTTNLRLAVTVPAHGMVRFRMRCAITGATTCPNVLLGVLNGATVVGRMAPAYENATANAATQNFLLDAEFTASGLTPGAANFDAAYAVQVVVAATNIKYGGPNTNAGANAWGAFTFEAWDPRPLPTAAPGAANGVQIAGSNAATTYATLTSTGAFSVNGVSAVSQTGDAFARLGAPAGASISADVAAAKVDTAAIKLKTDNLPAAPASTTNITAGTITTVTNLTNAPTAGDLTATMKTSVTTAATAATPTAAAVTGAVGSVIGAVGSVTGNVGGNVVGTVGSVVGLTASNLDATISSRASAANLSTVAGYLDTEIADIKAKTDLLPSATPGAAGGLFIAGSNAATTVNITGSLSGAVGSVTAPVTVGTNNDKTGYALSAAGVTAIWTEIVEGAVTAVQMMRGFASALLGKASGQATTTAVFRDLGDTKDRITATVDASGNRTAITRDLT